MLDVILDSNTRVSCVAPHTDVFIATSRCRCHYHCPTHESPNAALAGNLTDTPHMIAVRISQPPLLGFTTHSADRKQQLRLQDELSLLVLLSSLIGFVVFPPNSCLALTAPDVTDNMLTGRHAAFVCIAEYDIDDVVEEECFAMLATEVLCKWC